jgi:CDGSH-type Zn-finger protein
MGEVPDMAEIKITDDGPLVVRGVTLIDGEGNQMETKDQVYLCRCGLSANKPFCNGAHKGKLESKVRA